MHVACDFEGSCRLHLVALVSSPQVLSGCPALDLCWVPLRLRNNVTCQQQVAILRAGLSQEPFAGSD